MYLFKIDKYGLDINIRSHIKILQAVETANGVFGNIFTMMSFSLFALTPP